MRRLQSPPPYLRSALGLLLLTQCPFGPRGSTVSGRHVYGCAVGAGNLRFDAAIMASFRIRCASSHSRFRSNAVRLARLPRLDPTGSSTHNTHAHSAAEVARA